jgi:putative methyltransferase (TIGR04325 family)
LLDKTNGNLLKERLSFHEQKEQMLVKKLVEQGMIVFDVGANIGHYSILFSELVGNTGKVYAFEPTSSTFQKLLERLNQYNCTNVIAHQKALFSENKNLEFNEFPDEYSSWNSLGIPQMTDPSNPTQFVPIIKTEIVEAIKLDSFCKENNILFIDYLKIDVEGAESYALQGSLSLLKRKAIRFLQFEISQKMLEGLNCQAKLSFDILRENGYECHKINSDGSIGELVTDSNSFYENYIAFPNPTLLEDSKIMFWDDIKLVTEQVEKYGLREPFFDLGGLSTPTIADYDLTIKTGDQYARYVGLSQRPFDHIDHNYTILNPEYGDPGIEDLPFKYTNIFGTAVCLNVIEHIENPIEIFQSLYQLMKPNSLLIISTVFIFPYHPSPRDYWRYSPDCLRYLSEKVGFTVLECDWRLYIPASANILEIKIQQPQEIRSVYVTLTKGEFTILPSASYPLPQRKSRNEIANYFVDLQSNKISISNTLKESKQNSDSKLKRSNFKQARQKLANLILDLPSENLSNFYFHELSKLYEQVLNNEQKQQPLTDIELDFIQTIREKYTLSSHQSDWEYVPEGWLKGNNEIKGWNVQAILDIRKEQLSHLTDKDIVHSNQPIAQDFGQHNTYMTYAYILTLASRNKSNISLLDWGGGLGEYYLLSKSLLPDVKIDYHCKELPLLCQAGRELLPEASFYEKDEECFQQTYDLVMASSSIQYSEDWKHILKQLVAATHSYLYITRTPIVYEAESFVVLQRAYRYGYETEYLGWFINHQELLEYMETLQMSLVREFIIAEQFIVPDAPEFGKSRGFLFRSKGE